MSEKDRQENTARRVRVEDADYVLSTDEPNRPRVREEAASGGLTALAVTAGCVLLLLIMAMLSTSVRIPGSGAPSAGLVPVSASEQPRALRLGDLPAPVASYYRSRGLDLVPGVGVYTVDPNGPGAALRPGDVVTQVNGEPVPAAEELMRRLESADETMTLTVRRDGETVEIAAEPRR